MPARAPPLRRVLSPLVGHLGRVDYHAGAAGSSVPQQIGAGWRTMRRDVAFCCNIFNHGNGDMSPLVSGIDGQQTARSQTSG